MIFKALIIFLLSATSVLGAENTPRQDSTVLDAMVERCDAVRATVFEQAKNTINQLSRMIEQNPDDAETYYKRGIIRDKLGMYTKAFEDYEQAIKIKPDYAAAYNKRGFHYDTGSGNEKEKAFKDYDQATKLDPNLAEAYYHRAKKYYEMNERQKAQEDYSQAISIYSQATKTNAEDKFSYFGRGIAYSNGLMFFPKNGKNLLRKAIDDYSVAIDIDPDYAEAYTYRGYIYADLGEYKKASADARKACKLGESSLLIYLFNEELLTD
jgi:tetratricopeptide (TPR) repeat protein